MKILIQNIISTNDKISVDCTSQLGQYRVDWDGDIPLINYWYNIELEIEETLKWGQNIKYHKGIDYAVQSDDQNLLIIGKLESIDDDGYVALRVKEEMITFMTEGSPYEIGSTVQVIVSSVVAFPINY